jgi:hypothetical protein
MSATFLRYALAHSAASRCPVRYRRPPQMLQSQLFVFFGKKIPESRRKTYEQMAMHERLNRIRKVDLRHWMKQNTHTTGFSGFRFAGMTFLVLMAPPPLSEGARPPVQPHGSV